MDKDSILRAAEQMAEQLEVPSVEIQPVPTSVHLHREEHYVVITMITPIGENTFFLDLDSAERIAIAMQEMLNIQDKTQFSEEG